MHQTRMALAGVGAALAVVLGLGAAGAQKGVKFLDPLTDEPLDVPAQELSEAAQSFHQTGENPYHGDERAVAEGKAIWGRWCQSCHLADGSGRIGPSLIDDTWKYERSDTTVGQFEIIYAGGAGAMQAFGTRLSQDEILQVIAYMGQLRQEP